MAPSAITETAMPISTPGIAMPAIARALPAYGGSRPARSSDSGRTALIDAGVDGGARVDHKCVHSRDESSAPWDCSVFDRVAALAAAPPYVAADGQPVQTRSPRKSQNR